MLQINTSVNAQALIERLIDSSFGSDMHPYFPIKKNNVKLIILLPVTVRGI